MGEPAARRWVEWEEVMVSNEKGRREVHYYVRGAGGGERELAVVGRERSLRHMAYAVPGRFLRSLAAAEAAGAGAPSPSRSPAAEAVAEGAPLKWRSRREVVDWLSSLLSDSSYGSPSMADRFDGSFDDDDADFTDVVASKELSSTLVGNNFKDFTWLGSAWECRKRRKHYRSFCRRGITISVHNFVFIMSEEKKRLIAYVEDLYEDMRGNNMVVVQWFHKADEVGVQLPPYVDGREIFFSLCLQDFSVECIDGLAVVLSAQHFEKFQNGARNSNWQPYLCCRLIDNDDVKPFDITLLQGYWSQEVLRTMFTSTSSLKLRFKVTNSEAGSDEGKKMKYEAITDDQNAKWPPSSGCSSSLLKNVLKHNLQQQLYPGCHVEALSQDSGIRGCWFRCLIIKRHRDKIKVRYQDLQDVDDDTKNLEEWILASRIAAPDQLGIHLSGRPMVRPNYLQQSKVSCSFGVGAIVDAWWHKGWWEGIVVQRGNEGRIRVYFPGEKRLAEFDLSELRQSHDWVGNKWNPLKEREDIACQLPLTMKCENIGLFRKIVSKKAADLPPKPDTQKGCLQSNENGAEKSANEEVSHGHKRGPDDLAHALKFDNLKWTSRKRRRCGSKRQSDTSSGSSSQGGVEESSPCGSFVLLDSMPDKEICKNGGETLFTAPPVSSLVMSM